MTTAPLDEAYRAGHEDAVLVERPLGVLKITGQTRLDLINRMSTQAVNGLKSGEGTATVLTSDIGRIIDRLLLYATSDAVYAVTGENHADPIARYLMRFVFFNDDFHLKNVTADTAILGVYGPRAAERLASAGFPEVDMALHNWRQAQVGGVTAYLHRTDPINGNGYLVMSQAADMPALRAHLASSGIAPIDEAAYDYLRIEAGLPRFGREMTLDYIPLEANLWADVSFNKGCYTGQEIIARMESRGKLAKRLVALRPAAPVEPGEIISGDRPAGTLTSAADGPAGPVALGYIKTSLLDEGAELAINGVPLTVAAQ